MTDNHTDPTKDIVLGDGWSIDDASGTGRRTLVSAAVWTVPAVAAAIATPAAAASGKPTTTTTKKADLRNASTTWNAQGGEKDIPANNTFGADKGLVVHAKVTNDGPDTVTGITVCFKLPHSTHQTSRTRPHYPVARGGWEYLNDYPFGMDCWVFTFINRTLTLAPGESAEVDIDYWTTPDAYRVGESIHPWVDFQMVNGEDTNEFNNGAFTNNDYHVHT
ncbi:hypothetical protein C5C18_02015 [Rathayibacter tritici]|uniref:DUF11 domain-containing protein n=1 Tax=Rathayibacter tritici TaxID=33888 RepID=A0A160KVL4_9MICO|nr:hypothetical protein [Rathayibacter tritici]AND17992.1 hypothetical protein A6122_2884 [Rathayibacter tritici]PPF24705.1 hypothetical protein C5C06_12775 [Rathayibacter tritici]PPF69790.1 hypothetical protein C5C21_02240 [Rathayibacter tritici]PPG09178.1 hypothetical protein C5C18_02015 [Rathayibacter tritici]PPI18335.1 hypothetical protein C5D07_03580 [Rathayibacter tritici]